MADWDQLGDVAVVGSDEHLAAIEDNLRRLFDDLLTELSRQTTGLKYPSGKLIVQGRAAGTTREAVRGCCAASWLPARR